MMKEGELGNEKTHSMTRRAKIGVFHPGTQHSWQTALAFQETNSLSWFATSVFYDPRRWPYRIERWLPSKLGEKLAYEFRRRHSPLLNPNLVRLFGIDEWVEAITRRVGFRKISHWFNVRGNTRFAAGVIKLIEHEPVETVWGYSLSSRDVFHWAKSKGIRCILDQTIGHPRTFNKVMAKEYEKHPDFFFNANPPCDQEAIQMADEEVALADIVVVGSTYCYQSMVDNGCPPEKLRLVHYGYDETLFPDNEAIRPNQENRSKEFLFVGALDPRKGIAYLLNAFKDIDPARAHLTLVGGLVMPQSTFKRYQSFVHHIPQLPRPEVIKYFRRADAFIFPSLFEGSALVLYEAIGAGLGIIQSTASGTGVTSNNANGIMLDEITIEGIQKVVNESINSQGLLEKWAHESWRIREASSWKVYRQKVRELMRND